ncbi:MAG: tetratricopeptide repeat protein [Candidatus Eremiobacteraeota bacterium]|nr:tetratricopeptide repeat protein [Candidatus Eremiobacteraeota bacterium]
MRICITGFLVLSIICSFCACAGKKSTEVSSPPQLQVLLDHRKVYLEAGDLEHAEVVARHALETCISNLGEGHPETITQMVDLAGILATRKKQDEAITLYRRALYMLEKFQPSNSGKLADVLLLLGEQLAKKPGGAQEAAGLFSRALGIREETWGENDMRLFPLLLNLARVHNILGEYDKAGPLLSRAEPMLPPSGGKKDHRIALFMEILTHYYLGLAKVPCKAGFLEKQLKDAEKLAGRKSALMIPILMALADVRIREKKPEAAEKLITRALKLQVKYLGREGTPGEGGPLDLLGIPAKRARELSRAANRIFIGQVYLDTPGKEKKAVPFIEEAISLIRNPGARSSKLLRDALYLKVWTAIKTGNLDIAVETNDELMAVVDKIKGRPREDILETQVALARLLIENNMKEKAEHILARVLPMGKKQWAGDDLKILPLLRLAAEVETDADKQAVLENELIEIQDRILPSKRVGGKKLGIRLRTGLREGDPVKVRREMEKLKIMLSRPDKRLDGILALENLIREVEKKYGVDSPTLFPLLYKLLWAYMDTHDIDRVVQTNRRMLSLLQQNNQSMPSDLEKTQEDIALRLYEAGRLKEAGELLDNLIADLEKKRGEGNSSLAMLYYKAGKIQRQNYNLPSAARYFKKALEARPEGKSFPEDVMWLLGETYEEQNRADLGLPYLESALEKAEKKHGKDSREASAIKSTLLELYRQEHQFEKAVELGKELITADENPPDGELLPFFRDLTDMGKIYLAMKRPDLAEPYCEKAKKMAETYCIEEATKDLVLHRFEARVNLGELYTIQGKYPRALKEFEISRDLLAKRIAQHPRERYNQTVSFVYIYEALEAVADRARKINPSEPVENFAYRVIQMKNTAKKGDFDTALSILDGLLSDYPKLFPVKKGGK